MKRVFDWLTSGGPSSLAELLCLTLGGHQWSEWHTTRYLSHVRGCRRCAAVQYREWGQT